MKIHRLSPIAVAVFLAACGGSSSDSSTATTASGRAVDGYISGATVTCDANSNGVADTGETSTTTSATGAYSLACDGPLVLTGGTNVDTGLPFQGKLRAPTGSAVITPLTNLVALGMTPAKVAEVLGLPAGTDVTKIDPALKTNGVLVNQAVFQKTLALQQIIQQTAEVIFAASVGGSASASVGQAQYAEIAKAVATSLASTSSSTPLINGSGTVSSTLVSTLVSASVTAIKASTDSSLATLKTAAANLDSSRVATFVAPSITAQAGDLAVATADGLEVVAKRTQSDTILNTVADTLRTNGALAAGSSVNLASVATATTTALANGVIDSDTRSSLTAAGLSTLPDATVVTDYFSIANNTVTLGRNTPQSYTLAQLKSGITITGPTSSTDDLFNLGFTLTTNGTPITGTVTTKLGFQLKGTGADKRVFKFVIDQVNLTLSGGQVTASVPASAVLSVYAMKADGVSEVSFSLTNLASDTFSTSAGVVNFNASSVVTKILNQSNAEQASFFNKLLDSTGAFALTAVLANTVPIRTSDAHLLPVATVTVGTKSVAGPSVSGTVTVN